MSRLFLMTGERRERPVARPRDVFLLAYLPMMAGVAWLLPEASWPRICGAVVRLSARRRRPDSRHIARLLAGRVAAADAERIAAGVAANHHHARLQMLRCHRYGAWRPRITLIGSEHVQAALDAGRGTILWVTPFVFSDLVTKMAFHQAGFHVTHLSRPEHGFSQSRFGARFLNPIWTSVERRYLAERLVIAPEQSAGALRELIRRVKRNELISITVGPQGLRLRSAPFLNGTVRVAEGAPSLARHTGAALLPVFTVRRADGTFVTTVEAPAPIANVAEEAAVERAIVHCTRLLEAYALRWPDQYAGWAYATVAAPAAGAAH